MQIHLRSGAQNFFGPALRQAREQSRPACTQSDLAARLTNLGLPMDRSKISRIENQQVSLNDIELLFFTKALHLDPYKFLRMAFTQPHRSPLYHDLAEIENDQWEIQVAEESPFDDLL